MMFTQTRRTSYWSNEMAKLNSSFTRQSLSAASLVSQPIAQETLRKMERLARDSTFMCNQATGFICCFTKVQDSMATQLKIIQAKKVTGKSATKSQWAADELAYLMTFK